MQLSCWTLDRELSRGVPSLRDPRLSHSLHLPRLHVLDKRYGSQHLLQIQRLYAPEFR